jgi:hypothetical protein
VLVARNDVGPVALSHTTAAVLLDLPAPRTALEAVHLTLAPASGERSRRRGDVRQHIAGLVPAEIVSIHGLPVTRPARTVADCLRLLDPFDAVPIADAALHSRSTSAVAVEELLERQARWPRVEVARTALALADGRRETPLESRSFVVLHRHGLPPPVPQVKICDQRGRFVARVDFAWLEKGVVGEADGRAKYLADGDPSRCSMPRRSASDGSRRRVSWSCGGMLAISWVSRRRWSSGCARRWPAGTPHSSRVAPHDCAPRRRW